MRASVVLQVLLGAGALAHPHFKLNNPLAHVHHKRQQPVEILTTTVGNQVEIEDIFVATVWGSPEPAASTPTPTSSPVVVVAAPEKLAVAPVANNQNWDQNNQDWNHPKDSPASVTPASVTPVSVTPISITPSVTPVSVTPVQSSPAAQASTGSSGSSNDGAPLSGGVSILETANKYRAMFGFPAFSYSSTLDGNAAKTNSDNGANSMKHQLNAGSFAQCIGQVDNTSGGGGLTPFELTYLGWLCEMPENQITEACKAMEVATNMIVDLSDPGHAQILRNPGYSQIGCNYLTATEHHDMYVGTWTCDFK